MSVGPKWVEPDEGDVGEGRRLDNGGDEKIEARGAFRGEETGEKEDQGEERCHKDPERSQTRPGMEQRRRIGGPCRDVADEGRDTGGNGGYPEHRQKEEVVAEAIHPTGRLPVRTARR